MEAFDHPYFEGINWKELGHEFYGLSHPHVILIPVLY